MDASHPVPFLKWAGGKGQLLGQMTGFFPGGFKTYYEPFLGGGALFFCLLPTHAVLSDSNPELIQVYKSVRDDPDGLMAELDEHRGHALSEAYFYKVRRQNPHSLSPLERAARTVFLNKTCFNGLYRVNSRGEFNVPFGRYSNPALYVEANIRSASDALKGAELLIADFREVCKRPRKGDFVYFDPPYQPLTRTAAFTDYTREGFGEQDQRDLADLFRRLNKRGCWLMLSNSSTLKIRGLYQDFGPMTVKAKRAINSKGTGRGVIDELLVMNY
ncbi:MAG: DNA adenine methylase [Thermoplasmata archaeon]